MKNQKEEIIEKLRSKNYRITSQRKLLLDIILEGECTSCKEIYYKASKIDPSIGTATIYRMVSTLENIGVVSRGLKCYDYFDDSKEEKSQFTLGN